MPWLPHDPIAFPWISCKQGSGESPFDMPYLVVQQTYIPTPPVKLPPPPAVLAKFALSFPYKYVFGSSPPRLYRSSCPHSSCPPGLYWSSWPGPTSQGGSWAIFSQVLFSFVPQGFFWNQINRSIAAGNGPAGMGSAYFLCLFVS
jgi:hypothetical protein